MQSFYTFGGEHPFLFIFLVLVLGTVLNTFASALRRS
jgi:hypothetical protein